MLSIWLHLLSWLYGLVVDLRNFLYDKKIKTSRCYIKPLLINIGNLSAGGTGKTPFVIYLAQLFAKQKVVAVLSRGYKRKSSGFRLLNAQSTAVIVGDEPWLIYQRTRQNLNIVVAVCENRIQGIAHITSYRPDVEIVLLDDAFQCRSIIPHVNILLTTFHRPFFTDHLLPLGRLREPQAASKRADIIIVTKCPSNLTKKNMTELQGTLQTYASSAIFFTYIRYHKAVNIWSHQSVKIPPTLLLVTAIADPWPLYSHLKRAGYNVLHLAFPDHHWFKYKDIVHIINRFHALQRVDKAIITTEKDRARLIDQSWTGLLTAFPILYIPIEVGFLPSSDQRSCVAQMYTLLYKPDRAGSNE
ncbi:MAG: tetraacyldisaccharide 4'-kinase [Candidatus Cardinium sp.]|nr:tetraacyldisaccharide 4'-kinase [Candidatus Cardinium sp.]